MKVMTGKDKARVGKVEKVDPIVLAVYIPEINLYKKHVKAYPGQKGGIYDIPRPLAFSKIALVCPKCKKVTRVGFRVTKDEKLRFCRKCKKLIDVK